MTTAELLQKAFDIIGQPDKFCTCHVAVNAAGVMTSYLDEAAVRFCSYGALCLAGEGETEKVKDDAYTVLISSAPFPHLSLGYNND